MNFRLKILAWVPIARKSINKIRHLDSLLVANSINNYIKAYVDEWSLFD